MCVVAGCDYLKNIKSIGIHKAKQFVKKYNFLDELKKHKHAPANYKESFLQARNVFRHQLVYNIATKRVQPLHQWEEGEDKRGLDVCGQPMEDDFATEFVSGNINRETNLKVNSFPSPGTSLKFNPPQVVNNANMGAEIEQQPVVTAQFNKISREWFSWTPPCFPVLSVKFQHVEAVIDGKCQQVLISWDSQSVRCPVDISCTSYCNIAIDGKQHLVFWKWTTESTCSMPTPENSTSLEVDEEEELQHCSENVNDDGEPGHHTVPFKVMGVAYSVEYQNKLENAFELVRRTRTRTTEVLNPKIVPESDNPYDKDAIAVMLDYGTGFTKIGYIPKELTRFLHPLLKCGKITNVSVKYINFRVSYLKPGFYATIEITRKGQWEPAIVTASRRVM